MFGLRTAEVKQRDDVVLRHKERLDKLRWTVDHLSRCTSVRLWVQGHHKVTGGTCVVRIDLPIDTLRDLGWTMQRLFCAAEEGYLAAYAQRIRDKMERAYSIKLEVDGYDEDGDMLDYTFKWDTLPDL